MSLHSSALSTDLPPTTTRIGVKRPDEPSVPHANSKRPLKRLKSTFPQHRHVAGGEKAVRRPKRVESGRNLTDNEILAKSDAIQVSLWTHLLAHVDHNKDILRAFMYYIDAQGPDLKVRHKGCCPATQEAVDLVQKVKAHSLAFFVHTL